MTDTMPDLKLGQGPMAPTDELDTLPVATGVEIEYDTSELQAVCPVTGQPDIYRCRVLFTSTGRTIETKSLKLYFQTFKNQGILAEDLAQVLADHIAQAAQTLVEVQVVQNVRGGIVTTCTATGAPEEATQ